MWNFRTLIYHHASKANIHNSPLCQHWSDDSHFLKVAPPTYQYFNIAAPSVTQAQRMEIGSDTKR